MVTSDITAVISDPGVKIRWSMCENWQITCDTDKTKDNQEKALVGAFSVITNLRMELFEALVVTSVVPRLARDDDRLVWRYKGAASRW